MTKRQFVYAVFVAAPRENVRDYSVAAWCSRSIGRTACNT